MIEAVLQVRYVEKGAGRVPLRGGAFFNASQEASGFTQASR